MKTPVKQVTSKGFRFRRLADPTLPLRQAHEKLLAGGARILEREPIPDEPWRNIEYDGACWDGKLSDLRMMRMFSTPRRSSTDAIVLQIRINPIGKRLGQAPQHPAPCMDRHGG